MFGVLFMRIIITILILFQWSTLAIEKATIDMLKEANLTVEDYNNCKRIHPKHFNVCLRDLQHRRLVESSEIDKQDKSNRHITLTDQEIEKSRRASDSTDVDRQVLDVLDQPVLKSRPKVFQARSEILANGTQLTTGTVVGAVRLDTEDQQKVKDCISSGGNFSVCRAEVLLEKRVALVSESVKQPVHEITMMERPEVLIGLVEDSKALEKEALCNKAFRYEVIKNVKKCIRDIEEDQSKAFKLERDVEFEIVDNTIDDQRKSYFEECKKQFKIGDERDACKADARKKLVKERSKLEEPHKVRFAIYESKAEKIENNFEVKRKEVVSKYCGEKPNNFSRSNLEKQQESKYRRCAYREKKKFEADVIAEINTQKSALSVSDVEISEVSVKCEKGAFNFISGSYDECIDRTLASLQDLKPIEEIAEVVPEKKVEAPRFNCSDNVNKEIKALLSNDSDNIIGKMFHLTSLKIAAKVMEDNKEMKAKALSFEGHIARNKGLYNTQKVSELLATYRKHGKLLDAEFIENNIQNKNPSYYKSRMTNENISAFLLADIYGNPKESKFNEADAATAWLMGKVGENSPFQAKSNGTNLLDMSVLVYRNLNLVKGSRDESEARIKKLLDEEGKALSLKFNNLKEVVENKFSSQCSEFFASSCWKKDDAFNDQIAATFMSLGSELQGKIDIGNDLSGSIGGKYKFDFLPRQFVK